jgi:hypothetical protein
MPIGRLLAYVTNISSYSKHHRKHAAIHSEVNANVLKRFIFIICLPYIWHPITNKLYHVNCWYGPLVQEEVSP